jgi:hypothetical protein
VAATTDSTSRKTPARSQVKPASESAGTSSASVPRFGTKIAHLQLNSKLKTQNSKLKTQIWKLETGKLAAGSWQLGRSPLGHA